MSLKTIKQNFLRFLGNTAAGSLINLLIKTLTIERKNQQGFDLISRDQNCVVAFWHGKMFLGWYLQKDKNFSALVSLSKDGELLANLLTKWGYKVTRGSSHIGGKEALDMMVEQADAGNSFAITPDGSKGLAKKMKAGAAVLAKKCSQNLFLIGIGYKKKVVLKSWDSFEIPLPFTKVTVVYSDPIKINTDLTYEETSKVINDLGIKLNELTNEAETACLN
jgi:lysophospholipid acyltransferase (LPLAT)-like uncharacterized protein